MLFRSVSFNTLYGAPAGTVALQAAVLAVLALTAVWASFRLSVRFYKKRLRGVYQ